MSPGSAGQAIATIPEFMWELSLGLYLTFNGFRRCSPLFRDGRVAAVPVAA